MNPRDILAASAALIDERGIDYGDFENNFENIASISNAMLGRNLTAYDVAMILASVKFARLRQSPYKLDNFLDGVNYLAFAATMRPLEPHRPEHMPAQSDILDMLGARIRERDEV